MATHAEQIDAMIAELDARPSGVQSSEPEREFPLDFEPHCHQFRWMLDHLGGWQFGEQGLVETLVKTLRLTDGLYIEYGAGDGETLPLTIARLYATDPEYCRLVEIDDVRARNLQRLYPKAKVALSLHWEQFRDDIIELVVIDIDGPDSVVMREMLDAGCRPGLIVCEHMDRHYSIGTTSPNPIPEWLLGTITEHGHSIQDTAETLHWMAAKYGYERIGLNRCNSFFVRGDLFPLLFRG